MNGDILLELNSTDLSPRSGQPLNAITLQELESLMDQLSFTGRPATLRVLRKPNQIEEFSDTEQGKETPIASNSAGSVTTDTSDIDDRTEFKPTQDASVTRIHDQSLSKSNHVLSHPDVPVLNALPSYSDQPRSPKSPQRLHDVSYPNSSDLAESTDSGPLKTPLRPPTDFPLKKSLSAQIIDASEVGASCLHTPSQIEDSSTSRTVSARVHRPVDVSRAEPTHLSLSSISILDARSEPILLVQQPNVESSQVIQGISSSVDPSIDLGSTPNTAWSETPNSPLPPPPALSPLITSPISSPITIQPTTDSRIVRQTFPELPSPPSPMFFNNDELSRPHAPDTISQRPRSKVTPSPLRFETSFISLNPPPRVSDDHISRDSDDLQFGNRLQSDSNVNRVCPKLQSESRDTIVSSVPPAPPSPLLTPSRSTLHHPIAPLSSPQSSDIDEIEVDDCTQNRSVKIGQYSYSSRRKFYPPPLPIPKQDAPPPPPPRVPLNKGINPRNKCTACTRELGTGDLMIISSMSLYYHLACFVCSRCGEPLSDGLSNADVRIRTGQLYCQTCYPSKRKTAAQGDSSQHKPDRAGTLPARISTPVACADRRNRSRAPTYQIASGESGINTFPI
ncbi:hypothetical protein AHF37_02705 [Paragonimus kellicotti]|nr:hypothetical protein AHF37_02705 [Paragonimus kellicotti]